jgi:hypothetical protein
MDTWYTLALEQMAEVPPAVDALLEDAEAATAAALDAPDPESEG